MKRFALILLMAGIGLAADLTGKWSGTFVEGGATQGPSTAFMNLTLTGQTVTGTAGPAEAQQLPISKGKLEGKKVTFEIVQGPGVMKFDLTFDGDTLKGDATAEREGQKFSAKLDLKRKQ